MELVSVIVPVYNIEKYIKRCVRSIANQSYRNLEIILVDDGSKDQSGTICNNLAQKDCRIKVIHKVNGGLSDARNTGLKVATGQYVSFIDGDDEIHSEMIRRLYDAMCRCHADISMCRMQRHEPGRTFATRKFLSNKHCIDMAPVDAIKQLFLDKIDCSVCTKLYKRTIFSDISFPVGRTNEDFAVLYKLFEKSEKIAYISDLLYFYFQREGSITTAPFDEKQFDKYDNCVEMVEYVKERIPQAYEEAMFYYLRQTIYLLKAMCIYSNGKIYPHRFYQLRKTVATKFIFVIRSRQLTNKEKIMYGFLCFFPSIYSEIHKFSNNRA